MKFLQSIRVVIVLLALPLLLCAEPVSQLHPTDYVNDFAHVLDQTTVAQLDNICLQLDQKAKAQIAVVTINTLDGADIEGYAVALYKQWGIGSKATDHGVLILLAVTFTWLMGLMGFARSGIRQHWHVYGVIRDTSVDAFTPTLGFATRIVSVCVLLFFLLISFVFWLASLTGKKDWEPRPEKGAKTDLPELEPLGAAE